MRSLEAAARYAGYQDGYKDGIENKPYSPRSPELLERFDPDARDAYMKAYKRGNIDGNRVREDLTWARSFEQALTLDHER